MADLDARLKTALMSVNPTTKDPAWHGCPTALGVLRGVSSAAALWRPYPGANNIREIALHIAFWDNSVANRLSGQNVSVGFPQRKTSWPVVLASLEPAQWKAEIQVVWAAHQRLVEALTGFDPTLLDHPPGTRTSRPASELIHGVAEHTLYHTAQMEMLKTLGTRVGRGADNDS